MRIAYFGIPHDGGTYTVYRSLRAGLAPQGVKVFWLGLGPAAKKAAEDQRWLEDSEIGVVLAGDTEDETQQALALINFLESGTCDGVFVNVLGGRVSTNAIRFVSPTLKRIMIVHNITRGTYNAARAMRDYVHASVGVSPRIRSDLIESCGFSSERTFTIPNAVNIGAFKQGDRTSRSHRPLRLLSLGRIVDSDKGVFWLPKILEHVAQGEARLTIAGDGPDLPELKRRCAHLDERVCFIGRVPPRQVPRVLAEHDVFLFPSRFEGLGLSLVEAMAAGCVPVASRIKGVTDFVVRDGENGILFDFGDVRSAASAIASLAADRDRLVELSAAAHRKIGNRFNLEAMAQSYLEVLSRVMADPPRIRDRLPMAQWDYPSGLRPGLRTYLPMGLKNWLRLRRERLA